MKTQDNFSRRFLTVSIGISMMVLAAALFVFSVNSVTAAETEGFPEGFVSPPSTQSLGKYQMDMVQFWDPELDKVYSRLIMWNTETGASRYYRFSGGQWVVHPIQIPTKGDF